MVEKRRSESCALAFAPRAPALRSRPATRRSERAGLAVGHVSGGTRRAPLSSWRAALPFARAARRGGAASLLVCPSTRPTRRGTRRDEEGGRPAGRGRRPNRSDALSVGRPSRSTRPAAGRTRPAAPPVGRARAPVDEARLRLPKARFHVHEASFRPASTEARPPLPPLAYLKPKTGFCPLYFFTPPAEFSRRLPAARPP